MPKLVSWRDRDWLPRGGLREVRRVPGWRILALGVLALIVLRAAPPAAITIDYPLNGSVFPPEIAAPTFLWRDAAAAARLWRISITFGDGLPAIRAVSRGERLSIGEIDPRCISDNNELPKLTPQEAASWVWKPDARIWAEIKRRSVNAPATVTISGYSGEDSRQHLSRGSVSIRTSKDPVGAPIFYRDVPLMPSATAKGIIKPLDQNKLPLINWRLRNIGEPRSRLLLTGMYTCANCHSFSRDGKTMGMDLDGPQNDKGMYTLLPIRQQMSIRPKDVIEWSTFEGKLTGAIRVGFMSQVSSDGQYVVTMIQGPGYRDKDSLNNFYTANFKDYRFLQVFYPTRGILAWYSRETGSLQPLPGADDPRYVHTNAVWSPDGKYLVFARAAGRDAYPAGSKVAERANDPNETRIRYDLYRIPFNAGKGGQVERIVGASQNGMSNSFPKVSPDGRWIVFVEARNGELMRPDGKLYIVPASGGQARALRANTPLMNSWHSFSPNGRWLVFSSKSRGPYTKMFLTHLDNQGNSTPAILIDDATAANRAVNIPEFVNIPPDGLEKIEVPAVDLYRHYNLAAEMARNGDYQGAIAEWKKALELNPDEPSVHLSLGVTLARLGRLNEAVNEYQKALQRPPNGARVEFRLGSALGDAGKPDEAIARYDYALALLRLSRIDEAQQSVEAALRADGDLAEAHELLGQILSRKAQWAEAAREFQKALELEPELSRAHLGLASVLTEQGDKAGALQQLREAASGSDGPTAQAATRALRELGQP